MSSAAVDRLVTRRESERESRFDALLAAHGPALSRLASSYAGATGDRDDLLQEIAIALWQALPRFRGECSERTFLFRIAHNRAMGWLARNRSRRVLSDESIELPAPGLDPEEGMLHKQRGEELMRAIHLLPVPYRQVITLALEDMEYSEIAEVLGISETNVGVRLSRAKQMLRKTLEDRK